jgi:hypothetical protein
VEDRGWSWAASVAAAGMIYTTALSQFRTGLGALIGTRFANASRRFFALCPKAD